jgi:hypothetical protein
MQEKKTKQSALMESNAFICPITQTIMSDPVCDNEGNSYERSAIERWLDEGNDTSPITRNPLCKGDLVENRALRDQIQKSMSQIAVTVSMPEPSMDILHVTIEAPPPTGARCPINVCCVVDVSGSMGANASLDEGTFGISVLDVVKHAIKTIVGMLGPDDRFSLVSFSDMAWVEVPWAPMREDAKRRAMHRVDGLQTLGCTNLWRGLRMALDLCAEVPLSHVLVLTDGQPNISPELGETHALKDALVDFRPCTINTFGFGCSLNSDMLSEIALCCSGQFAFIPDASFVGTVFVNFVSHLLCVYAVDLTVKVDGRTERIGTLAHGQTRDLAIELSSPDAPVHVVVKYTRDSTRHVVRRLINNPDRDAALWPGALLAYLRSFVTLTLNGIENLDGIRNLINIIDHSMEKVNRILETNDETLRTRDAILALRTDLSGQASIAMAYLHTWGRHYLISLVHAHRMQMRNNFKDPGVQFYGGRMFETLKAEGDRIFASIPPPVAHVKSMACYNNPNSNSCFSPDSLVLMDDQCTWTHVRDIRRNHRLWTPSGPATVVGVVVSLTSDALYYVTPGVGLTAHHPYCVPGNPGWRFPVDRCLPRDQGTEKIVCNFVLDVGHVVNAGGVLCATLGHGLSDDSVIHHDYFGNMTKVLSDLAKLPGWQEDGFAQVTGVRRDEKTGLVVALI